MRKIILTVCLALSANCLIAQNTVYTVTNHSELMTSSIAHILRSSVTEISTEDSEREQSGMQPREPDTSEIMNVVAQWIMLQTNKEEQDAIAGAVPANVTINENTITLTDDKGYTIQAYTIKETKGSEQQKQFICTDGAIINLYHVGKDIYTLKIPQSPIIELRQIKQQQ